MRFRIHGHADEAIEDDADPTRNPVDPEVAPVPRSEAECDDDPSEMSHHRHRWARILAIAVLPALAMVLAVLAGFFKWQEGAMSASQLARTQSVQAAKDATVAILSYQTATVEKDLQAAVPLLAGSFKTDYQDLINKVVIPGARQQNISTTVTVPAASSISASADHAVVLLYVNQATIVGASPPTDLQSTVRLTLDKDDGRWLVSEFDPE